MIENKAIVQPKAYLFSFPKKSIDAPITGGPKISPRHKKKIKLALAEANKLPLNCCPNIVKPKL